MRSSRLFRAFEVVGVGEGGGRGCFALRARVIAPSAFHSLPKRRIASIYAPRRIAQVYLGMPPRLSVF